MEVQKQGAFNSEAIYYPDLVNNFLMYDWASGFKTIIVDILRGRQMPQGAHWEVSEPEVVDVDVWYVEGFGFIVSNSGQEPNIEGRRINPTASGIKASMVTATAEDQVRKIVTWKRLDIADDEVDPNSRKPHNQVIRYLVD